ncbi:MAG: hypothetical protein ACR2P2_17295 [Nakamurella sp.]
MTSAPTADRTRAVPPIIRVAVLDPGHRVGAPPACGGDASYGNGNDHHFFYEWVGPNNTGVTQEFDMGHDAAAGTRVKVQVWFDTVKQWFHYDYWDLDTGYQLSTEVNPVKALGAS